MTCKEIVTANRKLCKLYSNTQHILHLDQLKKTLYLFSFLLHHIRKQVSTAAQKFLTDHNGVTEDYTWRIFV